jgi:hypothetical protein
VRQDLPAIAKAAARVRAAIEESVNRFARINRYSVGADLRNAARQVARLTFIAWRDRKQQLGRVRELSTAIDDLKLEMMLAKDVNAFRSMNEFEDRARLVSDVGKMCGGWLKELEKKGQNVSGNTPRQSAHALSDHSASDSGVNP